MLPEGADDETRAAVAGLHDALLNREAGMTRLAERAREWEAEWLRRGTEQGIESQRAMLCRRAERKFGSATGTDPARLLSDVSDPEDLSGSGTLSSTANPATH